MMKKTVTIAALSVLLAAGSASAMDLSITGKYMLEGYMLNMADGEDVTLKTGTYAGGFNPYDDNAGTDSAWVHTFLFSPVLKVNEKVTLKSEIRFAKDADFGQNNNGGNTGKSEADLDYDIEVHRIWMVYMSPMGEMRMGRHPAGLWGGDFLNSSGRANRIYWFPNFIKKPFTFHMHTQKGVENDWYTGNSDSDFDLYHFDLQYKTDKMLMRGAFDFINDKRQSDVGFDTTAPIENVYDRQYNVVKGYGDFDFNTFYVEAEFAYGFGDWKDYDTETATYRDLDLDAFAAQVDAGVRIGNLDVGLLYFFATGDDDSTDGDEEAAMRTLNPDGTGNDFNPYYILTGDHTGMLNGDEYNADSNMKGAGVNCIGIHGDLQISDVWIVHGAFAYAWADKEPAGVDDEYGWEIDLGSKYKLLDNLTYELRAAYMDTGDFFDDIARNNSLKSDDLFLLSHHLTMTF